MLLASPGVGELALVWPTLARLSQQQQTVVLIAPPHLPHAPAWARAGLALGQVQVAQGHVGDLRVEHRGGQGFGRQLLVFLRVIGY